MNKFLVFIAGYGDFVSGFQPVKSVVDYVVIAVFVALFVFWKVFKKTAVVPLEQVDLVTGSRYALLLTSWACYLTSSR